MGDTNYIIYNMGSSYILIKKGLTGLTPIQLGSLRVIVTTILIAPIGYQKIKKIPKEKLKWVAFSAFVAHFYLHIYLLLLKPKYQVQLQL